MNPILRVIHYLFKKKGVSDIEDAIDYFFSNGINFPRFVIMAFNIEEIPILIYNPRSAYQKKLNNKYAYEYVLKNNSKIRKRSPNYASERDQKNLLSLILTKQIYDINPQVTLDKINQIIEPLGITLETKNDIINKKCLLSLLSVLTDGEVSVENELNDFNEIMTESFSKAKVPLVIDETCLEIQNQFLFFIQIEIIFETFSDKINELTKKSVKNQNENDTKNQNENDTKNQKENDTKNQNENDTNDQNENDTNDQNENDDLKKKKKRTNKVEYDGNSISIEEKINDQMILDIINAIGKNCDLYFDFFDEAVKGDNLAKFVLHLLKNDPKAQEILNDIIKNQDYSDEKKINSVIDLLKRKEKKFDILLFDFENPDYIESSFILLYTNILDFFFLKTSKDELYDRCYTLLYGKYKKGDFNYMPYHEKREILCDMNTYIKLVNILNTKKCKIKVDLADYFNQLLNDNTTKKFSLVITNNYLKSIPYNSIPNVLFYQLQFIFDALDSADFSHRLVECFSITISKFSKMKVPQFSEIALSIRTKSLSLILQNKEYKPNMMNKINNDKIKEKKKDVEKEEEELLNDENTRLALKIDSINLKKKEYSLKINNFFFLNGILYKYDLQTIADPIWNDLDKYLFMNKKKEKSLNSNFNPLFLKSYGTSEVQEEPMDIFVLYCYDEYNNKWVKNGGLHTQPLMLFLFKTKNPIILFLESQISDITQLLITINGRQADDIVLNDDNIYVYLVCNKNLLYLLLDGIPDKKQCLNLTEVTPVFLFLHVPAKKQSLPNIRTIVFQIYAFLSIISDINIVILDKNKCVRQIEFITKINDLKHSYEIKDKSEIYLQENSNEYNDYDDDDQEVKINENDYDFDDEEDDQEDEINVNNKRKILLNSINPSLLERKMKLFIIINDYHFNDIDKNIKKSFLSTIFKKSLYDNIKYEYYILNLLDPKSYRDFTNGFISSIINLKYDELQSRMDLIKYFNMDNIYVDLKYEDNWKEKLEINIHSEFSKLIGEKKELSRYFSCLLQLQKNVFSSFPLLDYEYFIECNDIISNLKTKITCNQKYYLLEELKEISNNQINYLSKMIESKSFWSDKQLNSIKLSHHNFLKKAYFDIVKKLCPPNLFSVFYADNNSILYDQIADSDDKFLEIFNKVKNEQERKFREVSAQKGTNHTIREKENEKEVKVKIEGEGELKDFVKQDY